MNENSFRHAIDISPWCKKGGSFFGMKRKNSKRLAVGLIMSALLIFSPPFFPDPTDLINVFIAGYLVEWFQLSNLIALALSYTLIPSILFTAGLIIYPHNTHSLFNGHVNNLQRKLYNLKKKPFLVMLLLITGYYTFKYYLTILG